MRERKDANREAQSRDRVIPATVTRALAPASGYSGYIPRPATGVTSPWRLARLYMYYDDDNVHTWGRTFPPHYYSPDAVFQRD